MLFAKYFHNSYSSFEFYTLTKMTLQFIFDKYFRAIKAEITIADGLSLVSQLRSLRKVWLILGQTLNNRRRDAPFALRNRNQSFPELSKNLLNFVENSYKVGYNLFKFH